MTITAEMLSSLKQLGVATVYEASGRKGLIDLDLHQIVPNSRIAGIVRTVQCAQDDNLMMHAVLATVQPGDILVLTMPQASPVALVGELLATQAQVQGVQGMIIDAAVRDVEELHVMGLPIWARYIRARGAVRKTPGAINVPARMGGAEIYPGDVILADTDGVVVVAAADVEMVLAAAQARATKEADLRARFQAGELSIDLYNLREQVQPYLE
jgi:4-hydroxy-4-methyl-2-oxoglutarate aldolase